MSKGPAKKPDQSATEESLAAFGSEVRQLRKTRQMTLAELARISGVSVSHLSAIERGTVSASLRKVSQIADALAVPEEWFFNRRLGTGRLERNHVVRHTNRRNLNLLYDESVEKSGYSDQLLSSSIGGAFYLGISEYLPHSEQLVERYAARDGELHGIIVDGELELKLEDETITLRSGDSFSIPGDIVHTINNVSDKPARLIWVNSPVIIPKYVESDATETLPQKEKKKSASAGG